LQREALAVKRHEIELGNGITIAIHSDRFSLGARLGWILERSQPSSSQRVSSCGWVALRKPARATQLRENQGTGMSLEDFPLTMRALELGLSARK